MEYILLNTDKIYLEDFYDNTIEAEVEDFLKYLDISVRTLDFSVYDLFKILRRFESDINVIFESSLCGYKISDLLLNVTDEYPLPYNDKIEISWFNYIEYSDIAYDDNIFEFIRSKGLHNNELYSLNSFNLSDIIDLDIIINNRYILTGEKDEMLFSGRKDISLRLFLDSFLNELTINRKKLDKLNPLKVIKLKSKIKSIDTNKAKLELIALQEKLEINLTNENFEECAIIQNDINKFNKIINDEK